MCAIVLPPISTHRRVLALHTRSLLTARIGSMPRSPLPERGDVS
ncbi:hypothetical protein KTR9_5171 (plasmid) [Gordonia sp. KTR9]|nr:hypothetical protein KTR9_5171 [Gordonia sp. KTR9]